MYQIYHTWRAQLFGLKGNILSHPEDKDGQSDNLRDYCA
jgi:hypothetical protein